MCMCLCAAEAEVNRENKRLLKVIDGMRYGVLLYSCAGGTEAILLSMHCRAKEKDYQRQVEKVSHTCLTSRQSSTHHINVYIAAVGGRAAVPTVQRRG